MTSNTLFIFQFKLLKIAAYQIMSRCFYSLQNDLSIVQPPKIYYDRRMLYHVTNSYGCRFKCIFTDHLEDLRAGDIAVFSDSFRSATAEDLKRNGVLIAFESVESPVHMSNIGKVQAQQVGDSYTIAPQTLRYRPATFNS